MSSSRLKTSWQIYGLLFRRRSTYFWARSWRLPGRRLRSCFGSARRGKCGGGRGGNIGCISLWRSLWVRSTSWRSEKIYRRVKSIILSMWSTSTTCLRGSGRGARRIYVAKGSRAEWRARRGRKLMVYEMINKKASVMGIEPTTFGLGGRCSTIELHGLCLLTGSSRTFILIPFFIGAGVPNMWFIFCIQDVELYEKVLCEGMVYCINEIQCRGMIRGRNNFIVVIIDGGVYRLK